MHVASVALALISAGAAPAVAFFISSTVLWCALGMAGGVAAALRARDNRRPDEHVATGFHIGQILIGTGLMVMWIVDTAGGSGDPPLRTTIPGTVLWSSYVVRTSLALASGVGAGLMFGGAPHVLRYAGYVPFFSGAGTWRAFLPYGLALSALAALVGWGWVLAGGRLTLLGAAFGLLQWGLAWRLTRRWRRAGTDERHE